MIQYLNCINELGLSSHSTPICPTRHGHLSDVTVLKR